MTTPRVTDWDDPGRLDAEMAAEQAVIDRAYARIEAMREAARSVSADVMESTPGGTHQARLERDVRVRVTERRLASLQVGEAGLVFGRTDAESGECHHIGRVAISDDDNESLVVDWRAPAAEPFYRATPGLPMGLVRRRHLIVRGRRLTGLDDELLAEPRADGDLVLVGEGALLAALERTRTGRMSDIVATIQREQDEIVRSPLAGIVLVQGGPGTGKTAVAIHRAAYLLYTFRFPLERAGVLLVGPNRVFLRYIEQVLPALGEDTVNLATPADLVPTAVSGTEPDAVARLKGDARMATIVANAVGDRQRALPRPLKLLWQGGYLTLSVGESRRIVDIVRRRPGTHNERRRQVERMVLRHLLGQLDVDDGPGNGERGKGEGAKGESDREALADAVRGQRPVVAALERMWPELSPEELLHDLFGWPALVKLAGRGVLDDGNVDDGRVDDDRVDDDWAAMLHRPRSARVEDVAWTDADLALLDEASVHLGRRPRRRRSADSEARRAAREDRLHAVASLDDVDDLMRQQVLRRLEADAAAAENHDDGEELQLWSRTFGHVVVDEAQDLSPMQLRMIGRRCPSGSMTIVGDLGQASGPWAPASWAEVVAHLPAHRPPRQAELTVSYRTPTEVMDVAAGVLAVAAPELSPSRSVRRAGVDPVFTQVGGPEREHPELERTVVEAVEAEGAAVPDGKVAVITAPSLVDGLRTLLPESRTGPAMLDAPLAVVSVQQAKGLEFDSVIVVEPARIVAEHPHGGRALYLALTRTTRRLRVVSSEPLPAGLEPPTASATAGSQPVP